jgi:hypothetical protein
MTNRSASIALIVAACSIQFPARAQTSEGTRSGFAFGMRFGYAHSMGKESNWELLLINPQTQTVRVISNNFAHMIPIWIDAGYRINPSVYAGAYFQYGFVAIDEDKKPDCARGVSCSAQDIRFGANIHFHLRPKTSFDPWIGVGVGY